MTVRAECTPPRAWQVTQHRVYFLTEVYQKNGGHSAATECPATESIVRSFLVFPLKAAAIGEAEPHANS